MRRRAWVFLIAAVALGHALVLLWLDRSMVRLGGLKLMDEPMFTRMLDAPDLARPNVPPPAAVQPPRAAPTPAVATAATPPASSPKPEPPDPEPKQDTATQTNPLPAEPSAAASVPIGATGASDASALAPLSTANNDPLDSWPVDTRLVYAISGYYRGEIPPGTGVVTWLRQDTRYQVRMDIDLPLAKVSMTSQGEIRAGEMWPQTYVEELPNRRRRLDLGELVLRFDDGKSMERPNGVVDTVGQFVALTQRYQSSRQVLSVGDVVRVPLARPGGFNEWEYDVIAEPALGLRLNETYREFAAFHLKPRPLKNPRGPIYIDFWLVPALGYFPGRVRINLGEGNFLQLDVQRIESK